MYWLQCTIVAALLAYTTACPSDETLSSMCSCVDSQNGVEIDCSNVDVQITKSLLLQNQVNIGLMQELRLRNVSLQHLPANFFRGLYIKRLDLSYNNIVSSDQLAFAGLENILQSLNMQHNNLTAIPVPALDGLATLRELDLGNNSIGNLDTKQTLRNLPRLRDLNLCDNHICELQKMVLDNVKYSLQTLNLGGNCMTEIPASALRGFRKLLALHLHRNKISQVEPLAFMNLPALNLINLANNEITTVHRQAFLNVPVLRLMYLGSNRIAKIQPGQFRGFETLEMLDLTENLLTELPNGAFANMPRLTQLYLGQNRIGTIADGAFANNSLVILLLPYNRLSEITSSTFKSMGFLQQLSLKANAIEKIAQNAFYEAPALVMLDLSHNRIEDLAPATFLTQQNMFLIDISYNRLRRTPYNAFNKNIMTVVLQENPLVCAERVHILQYGVGLYVEGSADEVCGGVDTSGGNRLPPAPNSFVTETDGQRQPTTGQAAGTSNVPVFQGLPSQSVAPPLVRYLQSNNVSSPHSVQAPPTMPPQLPQPQSQPGQLSIATLPPNVGTWSGQAVPSIHSVPGLANPGGAGNVPSQSRGLPAGINPADFGIDPTQFGVDPTQFGIDPAQFGGLRPGAFGGRSPQPVQPPPGGIPPLVDRHLVPTTTQQPLQPGSARIIEEYNPNYPDLDRVDSFLSGGSPIAPATIIPPDQTLPPNVVLAPDDTQAGTRLPWQPHQPLPPQQPQRPPVDNWHANGWPGNQVQQPDTFWPSEQQQPQRTTSTSPPVVVSNELPDRVDITPERPTSTSEKNTSQKHGDSFPIQDANRDVPIGSNTASATTTIVVCLTVVVVVMVAVFVTLCVVRHRSSSNNRLVGNRGIASSSSDDSSAVAARTSAYVAAQAAYAQQYGQLRPDMRHGHRPSSALHGAKHGAGTASAAPGAHTWIYTPGSYSSAGNNFYK